MPHRNLASLLIFPLYRQDIISFFILLIFFCVMSNRVKEYIVGLRVLIYTTVTISISFDFIVLHNVQDENITSLCIKLNIYRYR